MTILNTHVHDFTMPASRVMDGGDVNALRPAGEPPPRTTAVFWIPDREVVTRISEECRALDVFGAETHHALYSGARSARVVVVALDACSSGEPHAIVHALHTTGTAATVVGWVQRAGPVRPDILSCIRDGLDTLICGGEDALITGLSAMCGREGDRHVPSVLDALNDIVGMEARSLLRALAVPSLAIDVSEVARAAHCSGRTLERQYRNARLPSPAIVLAWLRLLTLARLMRDDRRSLARAATAAGFPSELACRRALRRRAGLTAAALRRDDACEILHTRFARLCATHASPDHPCAPDAMVYSPGDARGSASTLERSLA